MMNNHLHHARDAVDRSYKPLMRSRISPSAANKNSPSTVHSQMRFHHVHSLEKTNHGSNTSQIKQPITFPTDMRSTSWRDSRQYMQRLTGLADCHPSSGDLEKDEEGTDGQHLIVGDLQRIRGKSDAPLRQVPTWRIIPTANALPDDGM